MEKKWISKQFDLRKTKRYRGDHAYVNIAEAAPDIRLGGFMEKKWISKQFDFRKTKRYRGVIQSENYKTWKKEK